MNVFDHSGWSRRRRIRATAISHIRSEISTTPEEWRRLETGLGLELADLSPSSRLVEYGGIIELSMDVVEICERAIELANGDPDRAEWAFDIASDDLIRDLVGHMADEDVPDNLRARVFNPDGGVAAGVDREYLSLAVDAVVALTRLYHLQPGGDARALQREYAQSAEIAFPDLIESGTTSVIDAVTHLVETRGVTVSKLFEAGAILSDGTHWLYSSSSYPLGTKEVVLRRALEIERR